MKVKRTSIFQLSLAVIAILGALAILYSFAPDHHAFYPRCPLHMLTGLQCPGCGGLRAAHRLLHGDLAGAFHLNPLLVTLAPFFTIWFTAYLLHEITGRKSWYPFTRPAWGWALLAIALLFGIVRNILP